MVKDIINWRGGKFQLEWIDIDEFKEDIENITQVSGFLFDKKGRLCLQRKGEGYDWSLPGGGPEKIDNHWKDTLRREADEEIDVDIANLTPIGIQKSTNLTTGEIENQLRVLAKIINIKDQTEDIDRGKINERKFIKPEEFLDYCP